MVDLSKQEDGGPGRRLGGSNKPIVVEPVSQGAKLCFGERIDGAVGRN